jgi:hypothetical protein
MRSAPALNRDNFSDNFPARSIILLARIAARHNCARCLVAPHNAVCSKFPLVPRERYFAWLKCRRFHVRHHNCISV